MKNRQSNNCKPGLKENVVLKQRVITALVMLVLFLWALFELPDAGWAALVVLLVMQGASEWSRLSKLDSTKAKIFWWMTLAMLLGLIWFDNSHSIEQQVLPHLLVYGLSAILWLAVVPTWLLVGWKVEQPLLMALVGWVVLVPTGLAMQDLRDGHPTWLLGMMGLVWMADIAAYFVGRRFGKHKLAPSISPGKTWEGVAGAMLGVTAYVLVAWSFSGFKLVILPVLLVASWCWVALAVFGDLFESAIKRQAGVKDSGALLPGHGGLLDRGDALTSTLPLAALAVLLQHLGK
jgi:phosphatidate cytidylyltransferase